MAPPLQINARSPRARVRADVFERPMKLFACTHCRQVVFFESVSCTSCGHRLAYLPDANTVSALVEDTAASLGGATVYRALAVTAPTVRYRLCDNAVQHGVCNWAVVATEDSPFCQACRLNQTIPDLGVEGNKAAWGRLESAKRRLVYGLRQAGLPIASRHEDEKGLGFVFAADKGEQRVLTGHDHGVITINVAEADDPFREKIRIEMGEPYRTLLGHFRHEIGHYYWDRLVQSTPWLERFRSEFGDESLDYAEAIKRHYASGPPPDWSSRFISAYASMHPWEDWAETFAHYLHIVDTLDTARSYGLALRPAPLGRAPLETTAARQVDFESFDDLVRAWFPLTLALNSMNRGMGLSDVYPFVLCGAAIGKLRCVHELVQETAEHA
jgi:hypothetical protein